MALSENPASTSSTACQSWLALSDGLVAGVQHTLNNRMAALSAVSQVLEADLAASHPLAGAMGRELHRLEETVSLLSLIAGDEAAEPVQLQVVLEEARKLFEMHHALRDLRLEIDVAADIYPLWIAPSSLRRAVMMLLALAGMSARAGDGVVSVRGTGDAKTVELRLSAERASRGETEDELAGVTTDGAAALLATWGGDVEVEDTSGAVTFRVTLPTLPEARSRETAAS